MNSVLCASDLSVSSDEALAQAAAYCEQVGSQLVVMHVQPVSYPLPMNGPVVPLLSPAELEAFTASGRAALEIQMERVGLRRPGVKLEVIVADRPVYAEIVERAESGCFELLVVGSWGASGISRVLLGSVADKVVRHASCSVLVARPSPTNAPILVGSDFSPAARAALIAADREAARRRGSTRVTVLHCLDLPSELMGFGYAPLVPAPRDLPGSRSALRESAEKRLAEEVRAVGLEASLLVDDGLASAGIIRRAESMSAELVVLGTSGRTGLRRMLMGSVAEAVVRRAPCSVLVVRDPEPRPLLARRRRDASVDTAAV